MSKRKRRGMTREQRDRQREACLRGVEANRTMPDRWVYAQTLRDAGHSLDEIAKVLGVSRERVRQKTEAGAGIMRVDARLLMQALRDPATTNRTMLRRKLQCSDATLMAVLGAMGLWQPARRLFRWRKTAPIRRTHAALIRREFDRLGRTPTIDEMSAAAGVANFAVNLIRLFGSIKKAMEYAGVPYRSKSGPHEWRPGRPLAAPPNPPLYDPFLKSA